MDHCVACNVDYPNTRNARVGNLNTAEHKRNSEALMNRERRMAAEGDLRVAEAQITAAEANMERDRLREARALYVIGTFIRGRRSRI